MLFKALVCLVLNLVLSLSIRRVGVSGGTRVSFLVHAWVYEFLQICVYSTRIVESTVDGDSLSVRHALCVL